MREAAVAREVKVVLWQWPLHRVLRGRVLRVGQRLQVVAEEGEGALVCSAGGDEYFLLWPEFVQPSTNRERHDIPLRATSGHFSSQ